MTALDTHGYRLQHSRKHHDELITRVPVSYLLWMVNAGHSEADYAEAELARRGATFPELEASSHAIDRASLRVRPLWHATRREGEGLYSWLCRVTAEALDRGERRGDKVHFAGMKLVIAEEGRWPVLSSVMPASKNLRRATQLAVQDLGAGGDSTRLREVAGELLVWREHHSSVLGMQPDLQQLLDRLQAALGFDPGDERPLPTPAPAERLERTT